MGCQDGSCENYYVNALVWCFIIGGSLAVGLLWIDGYRAWASALGAGPVLLFFYGDRLSRGLDRAFLSMRDAWRAKARRPGRLYCPECAGELDAAGECARCKGAWLSPDGISALCLPVGKKAADWRPRPSPEPLEALCPRCANPLEEGAIAEVPSAFSRCAPCDGFWTPRVTRLWFEVNAPPRR